MSRIDEPAATMEPTYPCIQNGHRLEIHYCMEGVFRWPTILTTKVRKGPLTPNIKIAKIH